MRGNTPDTHDTTDTDTDTILARPDAEAATEGACCGSAAKAEAVAAGQGCCG